MRITISNKLMQSVARFLCNVSD